MARAGLSARMAEDQRHPTTEQGGHSLARTRTGSTSSLARARTLPEIADSIQTEVGALAEAFVGQVRDLPGYADEIIGNDDLRESAERSLELLIRRIAGRVTDEEIEAWSQSIGRSRLDAGISLDSLMQAVRLDFRLVWGALSNEIRPAELPALVNGGADVWEAVERHASATLNGYQTRDAEVRRAREEEHDMWLARLIDTRGASPDTLRRAGQNLGFGVDRAYLVAAGPQGVWSLTRTDLTAQGIGSHVYRANGGDVLIAQLPEGVPEREWTAWVADKPCIVGEPVKGLGAVPHRVSLITACLEAVESPLRARPLSSCWVELAAHSMGDYRADLTADVMQRLATVREAERVRVVDTVRAFMRSGDVSEVARALFCHRNTVFNRLQRFRELSGLDASNPKDAALISIALF